MKIIITNIEFDYREGYQNGIKGVIVNFASYNENQSREYVNGASELTVEEYGAFDINNLEELATYLKSKVASKFTENHNPEE